MEEFNYGTQAGIVLFQGRAVPSGLLKVVKNESGFQVLDKMLLFGIFTNCLRLSL